MLMYMFMWVPFFYTAIKPPLMFLAMGMMLLSFIFMLKQDMDLIFFSQMFFIDSLALSLIILTNLVGFLMILASNKILIAKSYTNFLMMLGLLMVILTMTFLSNSLIMFYILFEASLIPTFILILGWGYQPERAQAGLYMLLYTIFASLPLLMSILVCKNSMNSSFFQKIESIFITNFTEEMWIIFIMLAFLVKLPIYFVHLWLPKAHVEAPVAGSMILAATLLKLGGFGMIRLTPYIQSLTSLIKTLLISWALVGSILIGIICLFQTDLKIIVALSSVSHMALVVTSILTLSASGLNSALLIMVGHGFSSSSLFCVVNMAYERVNSRSLFMAKGMSLVMPSMVMCWFLLCLTNMAVPPTLNLLGEMNAIISSLSYLPMTGPLLMASVFLAAAYSLFMFSASQHGKFALASKAFLPPSVREHLILVSHWVPINLLILYPMAVELYM